MVQCIHAAETSTGNIRTINEDAYGLLEELRLFYVCDGMGGHAAGDFASQTAIQTIEEVLRNASPEKNELLHTIQKVYPQLPQQLTAPLLSLFVANRRLFQLAVDYPALRGMGTTIVSVLFTETHGFVFHAGDSRAYLFRNNVLKPLTTDHSWLNELLQDKEITPEEAKSFKKKNVVTRVLGTQQHMKIDYISVPLKSHDLFLLCSDGLTGVVSDKTIQELLTTHHKDLGLSVSSLVKAANDAGGPDNSTVMLIQTEELADVHHPHIEVTKPVTIHDHMPELLSIEDRLIKKVFQNVLLPKPIPVAHTPVTVVSKLLSFGAIILAIILCILAGFFFYKNRGNKTHPLKGGFVTNEGFNPEQLSGYLEVITEPAGAEIYVNDSSIPAGLSPIVIPFPDLNPEGNNMRHILIRKFGYLDVTTTKDIILNDTITLTVSLAPESLIELYVGIDAQFPDTADIVIAPLHKKDQERILTTFQQLKNIAYQGGIPAGAYELSVKNGTQVAWKYTINALKNKKAKIYITLDKGAEIIHYEPF